MAPVSLEKLTKVYPNGYVAVRDFDLEVADGEFMILVGPSGCGKTTAMRMVAGLEEISSGVLRIDDQIMNDVSPRDRDIAMVFQNYALYPHMTVGENIGFALKMKRMPKSEIEKKIRDTAAILGLTEWIDRKPGQLSGGQRQRVAMGRAIVREPKAFLMDEPLSNLDAKLRVQMRAEVARIQRRLGVATIYVTHDQVEAMTMGDRVAVMRAGVLLQCDKPQTIYDHPINLFVAGFMGSPSMNLFEARLGEGARSLHLGSQRMDLPDSVRAAVPALAKFANHDVVVGIRPESLVVASSATLGEGPDALFFDGDVDLVEALGSEILVHFSTDAIRVEAEGMYSDDAEGLDAGLIAQRGEGVARVPPETPLAVGTRVRLQVSAKRLFFFDPATGLSLNV
ncbi:MAG: sn-glycerol-3-phosphate ABC transporter ATP-binding protein UgpC [Acidimicrobiales bacterium]